MILSTAATVEKAQQDATLRQQELKQSGGCTCYVQSGVVACRRPSLHERHKEIHVYEISRIKTKVEVFNIDVSCIDASLWKNRKSMPGSAYGTYNAHSIVFFWFSSQ